MIRVNQLKAPLEYGRDALLEMAARVLRVPAEEIERLEIVKQSIDARKKPDVCYSYAVDVKLRQTSPKGEEKLVRRLKNRDVSICSDKSYQLPEMGDEILSHPPVIVGTGPAGLFCGLILAQMGYKPVLLERGQDVDARTRQVERFWETGELNPSSNVQFGEGGAGTFSDGKLNTLVKDSSGRNREVLRILARFGADPSILYVNKPHIGTDVLRGIVKAIRQEIERLGGVVRFQCQVTDLELEETLVPSSPEVTGSKRVRAVTVNHGERIEAEAVILAVGHSARDTFETLWRLGVPMEPKAFAVGLRVQHPQRLINKSQYGREEPGELGPASYKLTGQTKEGRGVYSFCMCPGGYVVNASSEPGRLAVNGMSYHDRAGENANSAIIATVGPEDFPQVEKGREALAGIEFQRVLETAAYEAGKGRIPVQLYGDFKENRVSDRFWQIRPAFKGEYAFANLREILPESICRALIEGMESFGRRIDGFDRPDAVFAGVESRTSSPVRLPRDGHMESLAKGIFPCGEGAGYAGGITSAAMDGLRAAEEIIRRYRRL